MEKNPIHIESSLSRSATKEKKNGAGDKKYEQYHGFKLPVAALKAHQVMKYIYFLMTFSLTTQKKAIKKYILQQALTQYYYID